MARECRANSKQPEPNGGTEIILQWETHIDITIYIHITYEWIKPEAASTFKWSWSRHEQLKINNILNLRSKAPRFLANDNSVACRWKPLSQVSGGWWGKHSPVGASLQIQSWNFMESLWICMNRGREHLLQQGLGAKAVKKSNELAWWNFNFTTSKILSFCRCSMTLGVKYLLWHGLPATKFRTATAASWVNGNNLTLESSWVVLTAPQRPSKCQRRGNASACANAQKMPEVSACNDWAFFSVYGWSSLMNILKTMLHHISRYILILWRTQSLDW